MPDEFPKPDVRVHGYAPGQCPNCGRVRLEIYVDGPEEDTRVVGLQCEKCGAEWLLDPSHADFHGEHSETNPLKPRPPENNPFAGRSALDGAGDGASGKPNSQGSVSDKSVHSQPKGEEKR